jgi:hypothetical protein
MTDYGLDFSLLINTDQNGNTYFDVDFFSVLDNDPRIVQNSDFARIFANQGDYDWEGAQMFGAGILPLKGKPLTSGDIKSKEMMIDNMSISDNRIINSFTDLSITTKGQINMTHSITLDSGIIYSSDITVNGKNIAKIQGS